MASTKYFTKTCRNNPTSAVLMSKSHRLDVLFLSFYTEPAGHLRD